MAVLSPASLVRLQIRLEYELDDPQRLAFYSHKASNLPSLGLRQSLGAVPFADSLAWEDQP